MKKIHHFIIILFSMSILHSCIKTDRELKFKSACQLSKVEVFDNDNVVRTYSYDNKGLIQSNTISFKNRLGSRDTVIYYYYRSNSGVLMNMKIENKKLNGLYAMQSVVLAKDTMNRVVNLIVYSGNKPFKEFNFEYNAASQLVSLSLKYPDYPLIGYQNLYKYNAWGQLQNVTKKNLEGKFISEIVYENVGKTKSHETDLIKSGALPYDFILGFPVDHFYGGIGSVIKSYVYDENERKNLIETKTVIALALNEEGCPYVRIFKKDGGDNIIETFNYKCFE